MALLMLLLIGYALLLLLPPVAVGAWGLGAERNRHSVCGFFLFLGAWFLSFFLYKHGMSWAPELLGRQAGDVWAENGKRVITVSCAFWLAVMMGRVRAPRRLAVSAAGCVRPMLVAWG